MMDNTAVRAATQQLAAAIRESEEYRQYKTLKDAVMANETNSALIKEYQRLSTRLQMTAVAGNEADADEVKRFEKLTSLLYMSGDVAQYLMAQMRVQQLAGEVFQQVATAAELELPGM